MGFPERAAREGPQPFSAFLEWALYDDDTGFYVRRDADGGSAGKRGGDFLTSPEVGPLFGAVLAGWVDDAWRALGEPDPFVVVEAGAGPGTLARTVLVAEPACAPALRWVLVERSARQRLRHAEHLPLAPASLAFAPEDDDSSRPQPAGRGPLAVSLEDLPRVPAPCVVVANELLDNLPFDLWEWRGGRWQEVRVDLDRREVLVPAEPPPALATGLADVPDGARVPVQRAAQAWLRDALALARPHDGGRVLAFDYCSPTTAAVAARPTGEWLRTYRDHGRGGGPLDAPGTQDVTVEVCVDQLAAVRAPSSDRSQAEWLRAHGIDALVEAGRAASGYDLPSLRLQSRVTEAPVLLAEPGLGAHRALEWR